MSVWSLRTGGGIDVRVEYGQRSMYAYIVRCYYKLKVTFTFTTFNSSKLS